MDLSETYIPAAAMRKRSVGSPVECPEGEIVLMCDSCGAATLKGESRKSGSERQSEISKK
jgi:hypothetical protein